FGNLIALPLQKKPRAKGNSLFLDNNFLPHADQWAFLSAIQKIDLAQAEEIVKQATAENRVIGVRLSPTDADEECTMVRPTLPSSKRTTPDRPA
ncbi:MAG: restriction endonuclease subunit R, partial [Thermodesulfobacteriota bacterium]|nr:restriction endonuclease subunit R [Thermodesulfobacteriota bacterium]